MPNAALDKLLTAPVHGTLALDGALIVRLNTFVHNPTHPIEDRARALRYMDQVIGLPSDDKPDAELVADFVSNPDDFYGAYP